jgi:hypothetical protein
LRELVMAAKHRVYLVPGFFGFANLGDQPGHPGTNLTPEQSMALRRAGLAAPDAQTKDGIVPIRSQVFGDVVHATGATTSTSSATSAGPPATRRTWTGCAP